MTSASNSSCTMLAQEILCPSSQAIVYPAEKDLRLYWDWESNRKIERLPLPTHRSNRPASEHRLLGRLDEEYPHDRAGNLIRHLNGRSYSEEGSQIQYIELVATVRKAGYRTCRRLVPVLRKF